MPCGYTCLIQALEEKLEMAAIKARASEKAMGAELADLEADTRQLAREREELLWWKEEVCSTQCLCC